MSPRRARQHNYLNRFKVPSKHEVIIMELCSAGSLFTMLDDPENLYGFDEDEFKRVLKHISEFEEQFDFKRV